MSVPTHRSRSHTANPARDSRPSTGGRRLRPRARKAVLAAHIIASGGWIGADLVLGVLVVTALATPDAALAELGWRALPLLVGPTLDYRVGVPSSGGLDGATASSPPVTPSASSTAPTGATGRAARRLRTAGTNPRRIQAGLGEYEDAYHRHTRTDDHR